MMYVNWKPRPETAALVVRANEIIENFSEQGYRITLRQLYYQLVQSNYFANVQNNYKKLSEIMTKARWAGYTRLDALYDPGREPIVPPTWYSPEDFVETAADHYHTDRWYGSDQRVELWAEKDAVASVLRPVARQWQVAYQSARGYMGLGAMAQARTRVLEWTAVGATSVIILYCGDHDASGQDIPRVIQEQFTKLLHETDTAVDVDVIALTGEQIDLYNPPPQPAKASDSRTTAYMRRHGVSAVWELDALAPNVLSEVASDAIEEFKPMDYDAIVSDDSRNRQRIKDLVEHL